MNCGSLYCWGWLCCIEDCDTRSYMYSTSTIGLSCTTGASYHHHGKQPGSNLYCKVPCDACKNQAYRYLLSLCQGSSCWKEDRSTVLLNRNHGCRHSDKTTPQGKILLAAWNYGNAWVIPLLADELSGSVGHSWGDDYNQLAEKINTLHIMYCTSGILWNLEHSRRVCFVHVLRCLLYLNHSHHSVVV